tara:strand:- start:38399 stop:39382 length:984 start_codon:yes stop_codon:yes gene_type:complete
MIIRNFYSHKNIKLFYYLGGYLRLFFPLLKNRNNYINRLLKKFNNEKDYIKMRVNYYNKINYKKSPDLDWIPTSSMKIPNQGTVYFFDLKEYVRFYPSKFLVKFLFGDITKIPKSPSFVKTRPIKGDNENSVLFKLNKVRHFTYTNDRVKFSDKLNILIGRNAVQQKQRIDFFKKYFDHPLCNLGQINSGTTHDVWLKNKISINEQLKYKFILCIEGYDVATNLKWVMSSNSIAVMPIPKFESWLMEGKLIPNFHYILIKDDFSDLEERLKYYIKNDSKAYEIIKNANKYIRQFQNKKREDLISLLILEKYFHYSGQINSNFVLKDF